MFSKTERKVHIRCEGERRETGRTVTVGMPVRTVGAGVHLGHMKGFLSTPGAAA